MKYLINQNNKFTSSYTKEEIQKLLDEKKIGVNTQIWTEKWGEWRSISNTDFNFQNSITIEQESADIDAPSGSSSKAVINDEPPGAGWQILAFFMPIAGIIMHYNNRNKNETKAKRYITLASFGFILGLILRMFNRLQH